LSTHDKEKYLPHNWWSPTAPVHGTPNFLGFFHFGFLEFTIQHIA